MAELKCAVENCTYNSDRCCCKGDIKVGGKEADTKDATCCESFRERTARSWTNAMTPTPAISIDCDAVKCMYNTDKKCHAEHVTISGCGACDCRETACSTFRER